MSKPQYAKMQRVQVDERRWPSATLKQSPSWCAVDLRDGNQALPNPMTPAQKKEYFQLLVDIGFKEIEVGFPSASHDDFQFCRDLITNGLIPDDVTISVLTQARPHLIDRTIDVLEGVKNAVVHYYIATSDLHSRFVFDLNRDEVLTTAVSAARRIRDLADAKFPPGTIGLEFSPEEFTDTDPDFAVAICNAVVNEWAPADSEKVILNLPQTVERRLPNEYADMIEGFSRRQAHPDHTLISLHVHNDMGCAVAATMQALLAGADRVEGTLFGHGERTGNVDLVTVALNLEYLGINTGLNFSDLMTLSSTVERITGMGQHARHPYSGNLVFTAFSGSHQDAIHKGLSRKNELSEHFGGWKIPYLHVDPDSLGRVFEQFIRINSQSGKGGIAHVLEQDYRLTLPRWVQIDLAAAVQRFADDVAREITSEEVWAIFNDNYGCADQPLRLINYWPRPSEHDPTVIEGELHIANAGKTQVLTDRGNGPISAFVHALRQLDIVPEFNLEEYEEETRGRTADAEAVCFVRVQTADQLQIGVGFDSNIDQAAVRAVLAAVNALIAQTNASHSPK